MLNFAANLTMMFNEVPFLERFDAARKAAFLGVEFLFPYEFSANDIGQRIEDNGLTQVLFNLPPGNWESGERGIAALPGREDEFKESLETALTYAEATRCKTLHVMAGIIPPGGNLEEMFDTLVANLILACELARSAGVNIVLEPLNSQDVPEYFLPRVTDAVSVIDTVGCTNLGLQFDFYHVQIMNGNLVYHFDDHLKHILHIQISSVQGRHEPADGEINYPFIFKHIDASRYNGWIGCEYIPKTNTTDGLVWLNKLR